MSTKLEELTVDEIESKMVVETRDIDLESKQKSGFEASEHPPRPHCGRTNHHPKGAESNILTRDLKGRQANFSKKGHQNNSG